MLLVGVRISVAQDIVNKMFASSYDGHLHDVELSPLIYLLLLIYRVKLLLSDCPVARCVCLCLL